MTHFKIIIPMYNVEDWVETTIKSVKEQTYQDYQCLIVDDISSDSSYELVKELIEGDERFTVIKNKEKKFALRNIYEGTELMNPEPEDVIVNLDGDDWFANKNVLSKLNEVYSTSDALLTYGNHVNYPDGMPTWPLFKYPNDVVQENSFRTFRFLASHLRTYKYKLWKMINPDDLKDAAGEFYSTGWDVAYMIPMMEMASERFKFIHENLYVYNNDNPINDYKVDHKKQYAVEMKIRMKEKYERVEFE